MINPLNDKEFLYELDRQKNRITFVRIIALTHDEKPLQQIEGRATGGSVNIDGTSSVRRTCSLTLVSDPVDVINAYWALKNKFRLEIGIKNFTKKYSDQSIIWFKMGTFGINSFSINNSTTTTTINISGQDKMCFLNGTLGGQLTATVNFGEEDIINDDSSITLKKVPIYDIIQKGVHTYAQEPLHNIIINDLEQVGYELWDFKGGSSESMYIFYKVDENNQVTNTVLNITFFHSMIVYDGNNSITLGDIPDEWLYHRSNISGNIPKVFGFTIGGTDCCISKISHGEAAGYFQTELVYAGDLIVNSGQAFTQVLDNIVKMLGEFEYFYDVDGHFIFQKKKNYIQGLVDFDGSLPVMSLPIYSYKFNDNELINQIQETPTIQDVRNDFGVWGNRKNVSGSTTSIYGRVAIQDKPTKYKAYDNNEYKANENSEYSRYYEALRSNDQYIKLLDIIPKDDFGFNIQFKLNDFVRKNTSDKYGTLIGVAENSTTPIYVLRVNNGNTDTDAKYIEFKHPYSDEWSQYEINKDNLNQLIECKLYNNTFTITLNYSQVVYTAHYDITNNINVNASNLHIGLFGTYRNNTKNYHDRQLRADLYSLDIYNGTLLTNSLIPGTKAVPGQTSGDPFGYDVTDWSWPGLQDVLHNKFYVQTADDTYPEQNIQFIQDSCIKYSATLDWRELIYQMARDYMEHHDEIDFEYNIRTNNPQYSTGQTGYEQYYTDMIGFWRDLYWLPGLNEPAAARFTPADYLPSGWHRNKEYSPELLNFWFDLLEPNGGLNPYAIETIGDRTKVDNDKSATNIYTKEVPDILFTTNKDTLHSGELDLSIINIGQQVADNVFSMSTQGKSVLTALDELIYKHVLLAEGLSLTTIPIYHIDPNTRIYLEDKKNDYIVTQMSIPLAYNGTMSITAKKVVPYIR